MAWNELFDLIYNSSTFTQLTEGTHFIFTVYLYHAAQYHAAQNAYSMCIQSFLLPYFVLTDTGWESKINSNSRIWYLRSGIGYL